MHGLTDGELEVVMTTKLRNRLTALTADADGGMKLADEISAAHRVRFGQDPVFLMWNPACAGIYQP